MAGYLTTRFKRTGNNGLLVVHYQTSRLSAEPLFAYPRLKFRNKFPIHKSVEVYTSLAYFSRKQNVTEWGSLKRPFLQN